MMRNKIVKPKQIKNYEKLLQKGCFYAALYEKISSRIPRNNSLAKKCDDLSFSTFEKAIDCAREIVKNDSQLAMWFDRCVYTEANCDISSIPRIRGSRSFYCRDRNRNDPFNPNKADLKKYCSKIADSNLESFFEWDLVITNRKKRKILNFDDFVF